MPAENRITQRELDRVLRALTDQIDEYHALRSANDKIAFGLVKARVDAKDAKVIVDRVRAEYKDKETNAVEELAALFKLMSTGKLPTNGRDLLQEGTGVIPLIVWPAVAGGAILVSQAFGYLSERERRIQAELGVSQPMFGGNLLKYAAIGVAGWFAWNWWTERETERTREELWEEMRQNMYLPGQE